MDPNTLTPDSQYRSLIEMVRHFDDLAYRTVQYYIVIVGAVFTAIASGAFGVLLGVIIIWVFSVLTLLFLHRLSENRKEYRDAAIELEDRFAPTDGLRVYSKIVNNLNSSKRSTFSFPMVILYKAVPIFVSTVAATILAFPGSTGFSVSG